MASIRLTRLEVWSDFECAGGTRLGFFQPLPPSAIRTQEVNGEDTLRLSLYRDVDAWSLILKDRVLRAHLANGEYFEYRIADIGEEHQRDGKAVAEVLGEGPLYDLGHDLVAHALVNGAVLHDFPLSLTPTEHLNIALEKTAGFTSGAGVWWTVGTVAFSARAAVSLHGYSALEYIRELQKVLSSDGTPSELQVVRVSTTGYRLDLLTSVGAAAEKARLRWNRNLHDVLRAQAAKDAPTRVYPFGQDQEGVRFTIGDAQWEVDTVASNDVVLLGSPIAFDDQFNDLYLQRADATLIQISDTVLATQKLVLASAPGLSPGDLIWIRKDAAGHELTYLDVPGAALVRSEPLDRPDVPPVDNLVPNPFLDTWAAGLPTGFVKVGTPTVTEVSEGGKVLNGSRSAQVVSLSEEEGIETDWIDVTPSASRPYYLGQVALYPVEGVWRFEILADDGSAEGITIPDGVGEGARAYTSVVGAWVERLSVQDQAVNFEELGVTRVKLRLIADRLDSVSGQASCYFDAAQLVQTHLPDLPFYDGRASRTLWAAANERLAEVSDGAFRLEVGITDLYRLDSTAFPHDQLVLGGTVQVQDPKLGLVADIRIRKIREELMQEGATEIELSSRPEEVTDVTRLPGELRPGTLKPTGASGAVDGSPRLDEDYGDLYLIPNRLPGAKSVRWGVFATEPTEADALAATDTSNSTEPILVHTFTEDREKRWVTCVFHPAAGGAGKAGRVYILTPWTFFTRDNRPQIEWHPYPGPKPSLTRIGLTIVDDGDQVAGYTRYWTDGGSPPAYTRNPTSGYVSDPHEFSVDVPKPASEGAADTIFEAYAEDDLSPTPNASYLLRLRVKHNMVEVDEPRVYARLDEDTGELSLAWDPTNPYGVDRVQYLLDEVDEPIQAEVEASTDFDATGRVVVHTFDPNGAKTQTVYLGYIPQSADSGGRDVGPMKVIPYTYRVGNDRPRVDLEYQGRTTDGDEKWLATVTDDGDNVALYLRTYDKGSAAPAYTRYPGVSGYSADPYSVPFTFAHPADGEANVVIEAYAEDDTSPTPLESDVVYKESDSDSIPSADVDLTVNTLNEPHATPKAVDTDALSYRFRAAVAAKGSNGYQDPTFSDVATDEWSGTAFGTQVKVSTVASAIAALKDEQELFVSGFAFNTATATAAAQSAAVRSAPIRRSIPAGFLRNAIKSAWLQDEVTGGPFQVLQIRAFWNLIATGGTGSLKLEVTEDGGAPVTTKVNAPDKDGDAAVFSPAQVGSVYVLTATPYTAADYGGDAGEAVSFTLDLGALGTVSTDHDGSVVSGVKLNLPDTGYLAAAQDTDGNPKVTLRLTLGTGAPGTLAEGELYGRHA